MRTQENAILVQGWPCTSGGSTVSSNTQDLQFLISRVEGIPSKHMVSILRAGMHAIALAQPETQQDASSCAAALVPYSPPATQTPPLLGVDRSASKNRSASKGSAAQLARDTDAKPATPESRGRKHKRSQRGDKHTKSQRRDKKDNTKKVSRQRRHAAPYSSAFQMSAVIRKGCR